MTDDEFPSEQTRPSFDRHLYTHRRSRSSVCDRCGLKRRARNRGRSVSYEYFYCGRWLTERPRCFPTVAP
ncbi:MAG: hypothetical protein ACREJC_19130 [Tepidisphaeraceae bacterium]